LRWNLSSWAERAANAGPFFNVSYGTANAAGAELSIWTREADDGLLRRALGCWLMCMMPSEGIDEALSALAEVLEFNLPQRPSKALPGRVRVGSGRTVAIGSRPSLVLED